MACTGAGVEGSRVIGFPPVTRSISACNAAAGTGLARNASIPTSRHTLRSSSNAFAVNATIGVRFQEPVSLSIDRMRFVASKPSIFGICMSIIIRSNV